jgi:hypothetical protein
MSRRVWIPLAIVCLAGGLALAQDAADTTREETPERQGTLRSVLDRMREAARLPRTAQESREAGADEARVREVLRTAQDAAVPAGEIREILVIENERIRAGGDPANFGAVVQELKASGLRGRALAEAIHAEQVARGMKKQAREKVREGQPRFEGQGKGKGKGKGAAGDGRQR